MEAQIANWIVTGVFGLALWFLKHTIDGYDKKHSDLEEKISIIQRDYLHRDDFKEFKMELRSMFDEIKADIREIKTK